MPIQRPIAIVVAIAAALALGPIVQSEISPQTSVGTSNQIGLSVAGFVATFATLGAFGLWALVLRPLARAEWAAPIGRAGMSAARLGAVAAAAGFTLFVWNALDGAAAEEVGLWQYVGDNASMLVPFAIALALAVAGFAWTPTRTAGWWLAGLGAAYAALGEPIRSIPDDGADAILAPLHVVGGSLWLGTLLVLVVAALPAALHVDTEPAQRGPFAAALVHRFSRLALTGAGLLGLTGTIIAATTFGAPSELWSTTYGQALLVKLALVGVVVAFGAWHERRVRPRLGSEASAVAIRRTAAIEIGIAGLVLVATVVLTFLPPPGQPPEG